MRLRMTNVTYQDEIEVGGETLRGCVDDIRQQRPTWTPEDNVRISFAFDEDDPPNVVAECLGAMCKLALRRCGPETPRSIVSALTLAQDFAEMIEGEE